MYGHRIASRRMHDDTSHCGARGHVSLINQSMGAGGRPDRRAFARRSWPLIGPSCLPPTPVAVRHATVRLQRLRIGRPGMLARIGARRRVDREEIGMDKCMVVCDQ